MKRIFTTLTGVFALILPLTSQANDCPIEKQVYTFKPTGKSFNIGMPPSSMKDSFLKLGDIKGEFRNKLKHKAIKTPKGTYIKGGHVISTWKGTVFKKIIESNKESVPLYSLKIACKK